MALKKHLSFSEADSEQHSAPLRQKHPTQVSILNYVKTIVITVVIATLLLTFVIINAVVPSGSMEHTIDIGDRLIGFRLAYLASEPQRGDVIIFRYPDDESQRYIKRIIGLPGDTVEIRRNPDDTAFADVYVNGEKLEEDYLAEPMLYSPNSGGAHEFQVPDGSYLVLGDNRNHSNDARFWKTPYVSRGAILAKAIFRYYGGTAKRFDFKLIK